MKIIPEEFHLDKLSLRDLQLRQRFVRNYTWAIPSLEAICEIVKFSGAETITEVGAGKGYWAMLIAHHKGTIRCFDVKYGPNWYFGKEEDCEKLIDDSFNTFYPVEFFDNQQQIEKVIQGSNILMFCWAEYDEPWAFEYLSKIKPEKVIYIGEQQGGCCADDKFFEYLNSEYIQEKIVRIPQWSCINDDLRFYRKRQLLNF